MDTLLSSYEKSLASSTVVSDVDAAAVEAGRTIARAIDRIVADPTATPTEVTKALYLTPHLVSILRELLATPLARKNVGMAVAEQKQASRLSLIQKSVGKKLA